MHPLFSPLMLCFAIASWLSWSNTPATAQSIEIPAYTAYIEPDWRAARVSERSGVTRWTDPEQSIHWYGKFTNNGQLSAKVKVRLADGEKAPLRLTIDGQSHDALSVVPSADDKNIVEVDFGTFEVKTLGYLQLRLEAIPATAERLPEVVSIRLGGPATTEAHFNMKPRRNAASVHLMYPVPREKKVAAFACEVTAVTDPTATFYMACGWHRGYFGMQVNSSTERRIIFSVWDSGNEAISRENVAAENRVQLMGKGKDVYTGDFGNEGTGGHSHLKVKWKTGTVQRFVATAEPVDQTYTIFSGYWFHPEDNQWMLISSWKAPKEGGWMRGLHSFSENFDGQNGHLTRKALYGNQWIRTEAGEWLELADAKFSHDPTGREDRFDRFMGLEEGRFFLSHGGFSNGYTKYGELFTRPTVGVAPEFKLPLTRE